MASIDAISGTKVVIRVFDPSLGGYRYIQGEMNNTATLNHQAIDITNKYSKGFRELLDGEGLQSLDLAAELIFNDEEGFDYVKQAFINKRIEKMQLVKLGTAGGNLNIHEFNVLVTSWAETSPDNDKTTVSVTFNSSNQFNLDTEFEGFIEADGFDFLTSTGDQLYVQAP